MYIHTQVQDIDENDDEYLFIHYTAVSFTPIAMEAFLSM